MNNRLNNRLVIRGFVLIAIAFVFGFPAAGYHVGSFARAGPGLFPLLISVVVGLIGLVMLVQARLEKPEPLSFGLRNLAIVIASLAGFAFVAEHFKAVPALVFLVFTATLAGADYSIARNLKICAVLVTIALGFHFLLGLNLPLI